MNRTPPPRLRAAPFVHWEEVRFRDLDVLGHVNNAVYATYFESTRIGYYSLLTGEPLERLGIILGELTISYRAPAFFADQLAIGVQVTSIGNKSFTMGYEAVRAGTDELIATGRSTLVCFDYQTQKTIVVPEHFRRRVVELQGPLEQA